MHVVDLIERGLITAFGLKNKVHQHLPPIGAHAVRLKAL